MLYEWITPIHLYLYILTILTDLITAAESRTTPAPPDEFSDLPPPPPELLREEPTPTNTPVHFAQMNDDFGAMHVEYRGGCGGSSSGGTCSEDDNISVRSSSNASSISSITPRNSLSSNGPSSSTPNRQQSFERCSGIRNSLRKGQLPTPPKLVAPPKIPMKLQGAPVPPTAPVTAPPPMHSHPAAQHQQYGHYGSQCYQRATSTAGSLTLPPPPSPATLSNSPNKGHFLAELNHLYASKNTNGFPPAPNSSESDSDMDELPPPPPELLSQYNQCNESAYDVPAPYAQRAVGGVSNAIYSVPPPPLEYNPYGERRGYDSGATGYTQPPPPPPPSHEPYCMSRVFASQTGTIKRAPQPPKRNNSVSTMHPRSGVPR